jgi:2'-5' RNA ligase
VFSLNAPVPGRVSALASRLHPELIGFDSIRDRHSILVKRLGDGDGVGGFHCLAEQARRALARAPAVEARVAEIGLFEEPPNGAAPVVYLDVESPGLDRIHQTLVDDLGAIRGLEGPDYTMHVTLARGGNLDAARRLAEREIDPIEWTISELEFWDASRAEVVRSVSLPA